MDSSDQESYMISEYELASARKSTEKKVTFKCPQKEEPKEEPEIDDDYRRLKHSIQTNLVNIVNDCGDLNAEHEELLVDSAIETIIDRIKTTEEKILVENVQNMQEFDATVFKSII